jgi:hypothetical protein
VVNILCLPKPSFSYPLNNNTPATVGPTSITPIPQPKPT